MMPIWDAKFPNFDNKNLPTNFKKRQIKPFSIVLIAPSSGGKTYLIENIYNNSLVDKFDIIIIFSATQQYNNQYGFISAEKMIVFDKYDDSIIEAVEMQQRCHLRDEGCLMSILFILDDITNLRMKSSDHVNNLFASGRHKGISTIFAVQKCTMLSTIVRNNANITIAFRCLGVDRRYIIKEVLSPNIDIEDFPGVSSNKELIHDIMTSGWKERYSTIIIDTRGINYTTMDRIKYFRAN